MTWHIGPTTWVSTSAQLRVRESAGSPPPALRASAASRRRGRRGNGERVTASSAEPQTKHEARVIRSPEHEGLEAAGLRDGARAAVERGREAALCVGERHVDPVGGAAGLDEAPERLLELVPPSSSSSGPITETGITATPVSASCAPANGVRSCEKTSPSWVSARNSSCRVLIDSGSFLRGQRRSSTAAAY